MNEKELYRHIGNILIQGLIDHAEKENAEFEKAMSRISERDFDRIVFGQTIDAEFTEYVSACTVEDRYSMSETCCMTEDTDMQSARSGHFPQNAPRPLSKSMPLPATPPARKRSLKPWLIAAIAAIVILAVASVTFYVRLNNRLCDSAALACLELVDTNYADGMSRFNHTNNIRRLPGLEEKYYESLHNEAFSDELQQNGMQLAATYLLLHRKKDAVKVLETLAQRYENTPFAQRCRKIIDLL